MKTITHIGNTIGKKIVDFMDRAPGLIPSIVTLVIIAGFLG